MKNILSKKVNRYKKITKKTKKIGGATNQNDDVNIYFFDNESNNIKECKRGKTKIIKDGFSIHCIKSNDVNSYKSIASKSHKRYLERIKRNENEYVLTCIDIMNDICIDLEDNTYFDYYAGLNIDLLEKLALDSNNFFVFDWDRTITKAEGFFLKNTDGDFDTYLKEHFEFINKIHQEKYDEPFEIELDEFKTYFTKHNILCALCGGSKRLNDLKKIFRRINRNSFFITANKSKNLIIDFASELMNIDASDRVFSTSTDMPDKNSNVGKQWKITKTNFRSKKSVSTFGTKHHIIHSEVIPFIERHSSLFSNIYYQFMSYFK